MTVKLTFEFVKGFIDGEEGNGCKLISEQYINNRTKLDIQCKCGNIFQLEFGKFKDKNQRQCPECSRKDQTKSQEQFEKEVFDLVGNAFKVLSKYINTHTKLLMKHVKCGYEWYSEPNVFLQTIHHCPKCAPNFPLTTETFKEKVYEMYQDEYTILGEYINSKEKIKIKHNICNTIFEITPNNFLRGVKCYKCQHRGYVKTTEEYKQELFELVGDEYTLLSEYKNSKTSIILKHNKCDYIYNVNPHAFLTGNRCPKCNEYKGEKTIGLILDKHNIDYEIQYKFDDCKYCRKLPFDYAIFKNNKLFYLVEFDGKQHFEPIKFFGGEKDFIKTQIRDQIKNEYCENNNINLLRIPYYNYDNIEEILNREIINLLI